jgi:dTDP-4-amino-4,6-dideoxygalactose transaminase
MNVSFVDLPRQIKPYENEIRTIIDEVIFDRADFIMRDDLLEFEANFAKYTGVKHAVGVANGSDAINLSLKVLGIGPGDEVITVSHTFIATIAAIVHNGATPVLVDTNDDHNMDPKLVESLITKKTKAIIPVHLNGRLCDMDPIMKLAKKHNLFVVEDSAQGLGATYKGKHSGCFGNLSTNSFYPFKTLGCYGDGGMITTNDSDLNYKLRCLRDNGQDRQTGEVLFWGWNSRLDNLQAAILNKMLVHLPDMVKNRRAIAKRYQEGFENNPNITLVPGPVDGGDHFDAYQNYVIRSKNRDQLNQYLRDNNIGTLISWPIPSHHHKNLNLSHFSLPHTETLSKEVISLPMHPELSMEEVDFVIKTVNSFKV